MTTAPAYPTAAHARDRFVLDRRGPRMTHDPWRHQGVLVEDERAADGTIWQTATVFLTGRECPWRCAMCDLWQFTTEQDTPRGALVGQLHDARLELETGIGSRESGIGTLPESIKLYNAGSFFDPRAVPEADYGLIADVLRGFRHIVVESHPSLVGARLLRFKDVLEHAAQDDDPASLEVAMGLETAHPMALERLHKRFTLPQFARAAERVRVAGADLRVFLLVGVPFLPQGAQLDWLRRSVDFAFDCGASVVSLIPTRPGNGALDAIARDGAFESPRPGDLEAALEAALGLSRGRVCADLWDFQRLARCGSCVDARRARLHDMNITQEMRPRVACAHCGGGACR